MSSEFAVLSVVLSERVLARLRGVRNALMRRGVLLASREGCAVVTGTILSLSSSSSSFL